MVIGRIMRVRTVVISWDPDHGPPTRRENTGREASRLTS